MLALILRQELIVIGQTDGALQASHNGHGSIGETIYIT
jgi:hypothetical protein